MRNLNCVDFTPALTEVKASAKWALILFVPAAALVIATSVLLGGFHGWGGLPFLIAFAPFVAMDSLIHIPRSNNPWGLLVAIPIEWAYLFLVVLAWRWVFRWPIQPTEE
jgi:hypothetical protein